MPCYHPINALQPTTGGRLVFPQPETEYLYNDYRALQITCGRCRGCRLKRSREWAMRCVHEMQMHRYNCYITLTLADEHLNDARSLDHSQFQRFIKRLRKALSKGVDIHPSLLVTHTARRADIPQAGMGRVKPIVPLRYYMCGEYGETYGRPHYHAILFGVDFNDKIYYKMSPSGDKLYRSAMLEKLWPDGYSTIGTATFESAAYIARYVMKKRNDGKNHKTTEILDLETGEIITRKTEYNNMSRHAAIGKAWLMKYKDDVYTRGKVILRGRAYAPPRYYDKQLPKLDLQTGKEIIEELKWERQLEAIRQIEHHTPERLAVQEQVAEAKTKRLQRHFDLE